MEVFDINGQIISPLAGKTLYVAGDSIAYGKGSAGGYGKCIADKYGMTLTNEAVDGATLTPNITDKVYGGTRGCISTVVTNSTALAKADYILLEGGVNDAWNNAPVGTLTDGFAAAYDETTMTGALEKMLDDLAKNHSDKRVAYVFPHGGMFGSSENWYKTYKPAILAALKNGACLMLILRRPLRLWAAPASANWAISTPATAPTPMQRATSGFTRSPSRRC